MYVIVLLNSLMRNHFGCTVYMFFCIYDIFHTLQSFDLLWIQGM